MLLQEVSTVFCVYPGFLQDIIAAKMLLAGMGYLAVDPKKFHRSREEVMTMVKGRLFHLLEEYLHGEALLKPTMVSTFSNLDTGSEDLHRHERFFFI